MRGHSFDVHDVLDWAKENGSLGGIFAILFKKMLRWAEGKVIAVYARPGRMGANTLHTWE